MKNLRNEDGTYNIYDRYNSKETGEDFGWRTVTNEWLENVNLSRATEIEWLFDGHLKVSYHYKNDLYYENVHGSWGFPVCFI